MASFDLGFDVAAPPEISSEDADISSDFFPQDIVFGEVVMSTSTYETQQKSVKKSHSLKTLKTNVHPHR